MWVAVLSHTVLSHFSEELPVRWRLAVIDFYPQRKQARQRRRIVQDLLSSKGAQDPSPPPRQQKHQLVLRSWRPGCQLGPVISCCLISSFLKEGKVLFKELGVINFSKERCWITLEWDVPGDSANQHFRCSARIYGPPPMCQAPVRLQQPQPWLR